MTPEEFAREFIARDTISDSSVSRWRDPQLLWAQDACQSLTQDEFFEALKLIDKQRKTQAKKRYHYMVTYTIDPKKHPDITEDLIARIERYIETQADRTGLQVEESSYVRETHKNGRPHWHQKFIVTKSIRSDAFVQFTRAYGNVKIDLSHTNGKHIDIYMEKEGTIKKLK